MLGLSSSDDVLLIGSSGSGVQEHCRYFTEILRRSKADCVFDINTKCRRGHTSGNIRNHSIMKPSSTCRPRIPLCRSPTRSLEKELEKRLAQQDSQPLGGVVMQVSVDL